MDKTLQSGIQSTEQKIIQAAEQEFLIKGYDGARTTSIAAKAGVTHAMFHYYFRTKERLFEKIITEKIGLMAQLIIGSVSDDTLPLEDKIYNIINHHIDFIAENPDLPGFLVREVFDNQERLKEFCEKFEKNVPLIIENLQKDLDKGFMEGRYKKIESTMLLIDILSLNIFPYMAAPMINSVLGNCISKDEEFKKKRKEENFRTIISKIKI